MIELLISSSILITVIALMRALFRSRIPPGLQYALWLLVLLRLALPFHLISSPVSAAGAFTQTVQTAQITGSPDAASPQRSGAEIGSVRQDAAKTDPSRVLVTVWLTGSGVMAVWFGIVNTKLALHLHRGRRRLSYDAPIPIYLVEGLSSPCLYGLFRPAVYLTEKALETPQEEGSTIEHELTHWRHLDDLWSVARILCLIVYWFDPFVWLAAWLSRQDCELYCDARTIRRIGEERRYEYGRTLLKLSEAAVRPSDLICSASTMSGGARRMRERIILIARRPKYSILLSAAAVIIALTAVICTFSSPSAALEAGPTEIMSTSPPLIIETPAPAEAMAALPSTPITIADETEIIPSVPVPTPIPTAPPERTQAAYEDSQSGRGYEAIIDNTSYGNEPLAAEWQDPEPTVLPTATPAPQRQDPDPIIKPTPTPTPPWREPETAVLPAPTPVPEEAQQIVVRDMRDVYMNTEGELPADMPSTMPDTPTPAPTPEP